MAIRFGLAALAACGIAAASGTAARAQQALPFEQITAALNGVHQFSQVAISPDGRRIAYVESAGDRNVVRLADLEGAGAGRGAVGARLGAVRAATACPGRACDETEVAWSPDGRRVAFVSAGPNGQPQIAVAEVAGTGAVTARIVTAAKGPLATPRWSPDGTRIAFLYSPGAPKVPSPLNPSTPDAGVVGSKIYEQRLAVISVPAGSSAASASAGARAMKLLGPADLNVYEFDWSPDGTRFAATAAHGNGDANWWIAQLYAVDAASGAAKAIHKPELQIASPRWSGDGKRIAYIGGIMSDEAITGGDVYVVPASGGAATDVTPGLKASVTTIAWNGSPARILATELAGDRMVIATVDVAAKTQRQSWSGQETIYAKGFAGVAPGDEGVSVSRDGKTAATIRQSITAPPEIAVGALGAMHAVTSANARVRRLTGAARSVTWTSEGASVQGWLIFPPGAKPGGRYPIVTSIHGGPAFAHYPLFPSGPFAFEAALAARGYIVFEPNPRGSYGQGEAFTRANVKDFGYGDLRDVLLGLDEVGRTIPVDPNKLGIFGWSYGGYMTMWALTQTNRFKAAVSGAGLSDWLSYYGTNEIDTWMIPYFGASVYDDPAVYAKSSPINYVKQVRTPTLMVAGDRDAEVPVTQSYEYWHALRDRGVPAQLVIYPGEGHLFWKPADQQDVFRRMTGWFDRWLGAKTPLSARSPSAHVVALVLASPAPSVPTWPPAVATCAPNAGSNRYLCPQNDPALVEMFAKARAHDVAGVEAAGARIRTGDGPADMIEPKHAKLARAFALALANPAAYESAYVRTFIDNGFTGYVLLDQINAAGLAPSAFDIIVRRSAAGDGLASAAILGATAPINEFHPPFDGWAIAHNGARLFAAMAAAGPEPAARYLCTEQDEGRDPGAARRTVAKLKATTPKGRALLAQLKAMIAHCYTYDANF
jgi:dipeptidyl aminopeptidase/acylaminoacyl peptidase